jgi:hypothetical protein
LGMYTSYRRYTAHNLACISLYLETKQRSFIFPRLGNFRPKQENHDWAGLVAVCDSPTAALELGQGIGV